MDRNKCSTSFLSMLVICAFVLLWCPPSLKAQGGKWQIQYDREADEALGLEGKTLQGSFGTLKECETYRKSLPEYVQNHTKSVRSDVPAGAGIQTLPNPPGASRPAPPGATHREPVANTTNTSSSEVTVDAVVTSSTEDTPENNNIPSEPDQSAADLEAAAEDEPDIPEIVVQVGHFKQVNSVVLSPDGMLALSGGRDGIIKLWDAYSGKEIRSFAGSNDEINSVAISPDGQYALTGSQWVNSNVQLWSISTGKVVRNFNGFGDMVSSVAMSPDGQYVAASSAQSIKVWKTETGEEVNSFTGHTGNVKIVVFTPDGRSVISGGEDKMIKEWNIGTGKNTRTFTGHTNPIDNLAISPDGRFIFSCSFRDKPMMWDMNTGYLSKTFDCDGISSLAISPDGKSVIFAGMPDIQIWDIAKGEKIKKLKIENESWVRSMAYSQDGRFVLTGSEDNTVKLWDAGSGKEIWAAGRQTFGVSSVAISPDGGKLIAGMEAGSLNIWDLSSGTQIKSISHNMGVECVAITSGGAKSFAGGWDFKEHTTSIKQWDNLSGEEILNLKLEGGSWAKCLALTNDGKNMLYSAGETLYLSDIDSGEKLQTYNGLHQTGITDLSTYGNYAISRDRIEALQLWEVSTGKIIHSFPGYHGDISSDGNNVLLMGLDISKNDYLDIKVWDIANNREKSSVSAYYPLRKSVGSDTYRSRQIGSLAFSPDNALAVWSCGNELHLWNIAEAKELFIMKGHINRVTTVGFSPNGKFAFSGSMDGSTRLWNIETGKEIVRLYSFKDGEWVIMTPGGYFDASPQGAKYLAVREANYVYDINRVQYAFQSPSEIQNALQGREVRMDQTVAYVLAMDNIPSASSNLGFGLIEIVLLLLVLFVIPFFIALVDLLRHDFTGNNKIIWLLTILLIPFIGTILYFFIGRKQKIK